MEQIIEVERENVEQPVNVEREPMTLNIGGTTDYNGLSNKPSINGTTLSGDKSLSDLGIQPAGSYVNESSYNAKINEIEDTLSNQGTSIADLSNDKADKSEMPTKTSDLTNDSGFITDYTETDPTVPNYVKNITQANITSWNNKSDFSGNYNDLTNKPSIPTKTSDLTNDSRFVNEQTLESSINDVLVYVDMNFPDISGKQDKEKTQVIVGDTASITPENNTIYQCGTLTSLTITNPPATGSYSIIFTSGSTATTTVIPATLLGLDDFVAEVNTMYEINVFDNRAVVGSWAVSAT